MKKEYAYKGLTFSIIVYLNCFKPGTHEVVLLHGDKVVISGPTSAENLEDRISRIENSARIYADELLKDNGEQTLKRLGFK